MADASVFLRKRKDKIRQRVPTNANRPTPPPSAPVRPAGQTPEVGAAGSSGSAASSSNNPNIVELKLFSAGDLGGTRFNLMRLHSKDEVEPDKMSQPILFNRKPRGEQGPPSLAYDAEGKVVGKYLYDPSGKPIVGADGEHVIDRTQSADLSLIGGAPGMAKKRNKRSIKEVSNQDPEQIRLKREEADPWVLESQHPAEKPEIPEHWVGMLQEPSSMPTVLLINDGTMGMSYNVVPFGRTYRFDPERPFRPLDADAANKLYEHQVRHRIHDRWAHREGGPVTVTQREANLQVKQEQRAARMEEQMRLARGDAVRPTVKQERFDDDYKREGRRLERGMEGGEDEELDYDANEEFQDDEDNNTFHRNEEEEEEAKLLEERLRKEFRMANANVGDRPQIESGDESEDDDLFGARLNIEGKRLKKMMRKRGETDDIFGSDDSDDDDDSEEEKPKKENKEDKKEDKSAPPSVERPSRPPSRGPGSRAATSPAPPARRPGGPPTPSKAGTAPPGSGAAFLAQRAASRGGSPRRSRQGSPISGSARGQSPDSGSVRGSSPASRGGSPVPNGSSNGGPTKKRKSTESPAPEGPNKRKSSPTGSVAGSDAGGSRKKKKSSSATPTPRDIEPFPGMITRDEVLQWFRNAGKALVPMGEVIQAFKNRLAVEKEKNQAVFLSHVGAVTEKQPGRMLKLKDEYAS